METIQFKNFQKQNLKSIVFFVSLFIFTILFTNPRLCFSEEILKFNVPFSKVAPIKTSTLTGASNFIKVKIPASDRWQIKRATLNFSYINSTALLQSRSRLVVWLNEHPIAQITLNPHLPEGKVSVNLPVNLIKSGYNELKFTVAQHYTLECEDPGSSELWTTIEFDKASFDFEIALKKVPEDLTAISNFLFDSKSFIKHEINLVIPELKEEFIESAMIVASGIAMKFEYRPVNFTVSQNIKNGVDNIVIGDSIFIKELTGDLFPDKEAYIKIKALPNDPYHALIILKGDTAEEIKKSALAFASINFPFPKTSSMKIENVKITPQTPKIGKSTVLPGYEYSFKDLGFFTTNFQGVGAKSVSMDFKIPSDTFLKPNSFVTLKLNFSYGSGMRKDSTLNIQINGKYVASIYLENVRGGLIRNYLIDIPLSLFKPGYNQITFTAVLSPLITGYCEFVQTENLQLTLFEDSKILFPKASYWAEMPNINLFFVDAFPFSRPYDFGNSGVYLTEKSNEILSSAINLIAMASQKAGYLPINLKVSFDIGKLKDKNLLIVGTITKIPEEYLKAGNIKNEPAGSFVYYLSKNFEKSESSINSKIRSIIEKIFPLTKTKSDYEYSKSLINLSSKLEGNFLVISEFVSPYKSRNTILMISSIDGKELSKGISALWEPSVSAKTFGSLVIFDTTNPEETLFASKGEDTYYLGNLGFLTSVTSWIYAHPVLFTLLIMLIIAILAFFIFRFIKKFRRIRMGEKKS
ncbi:MAG: cellulose biosynthesis cyclic di-GMP-binding regulatory protein BcsB [Thermodesulfovibrio sp.]|nr:cellulose biosynthesis cyclic di-GMP-binding regulatory protein BcsB [Thermodesulfovibrio sp.]